MYLGFMLETKMLKTVNVVKGKIKGEYKERKKFKDETVKKMG